MTKYREILRLKSLGFSERNIAHSCGVSRNTVAKVVKKAAEIKLSWPLDHDMTDSTLEEMLFPKTKSATNKRMPDYDYWDLNFQMIFLLEVCRFILVREHVRVFWHKVIWKILY